MLGKKSTAKEVIDFFASDLTGKTAVVTGGNSGIGLETVKALAYAGARVLLCCRNVEAGRRAIEEGIRAEGASGYAVPEAQVVVKQLDLADLRQVRTFAEDVLATEPRVDFLVLNAGVMSGPLSYTAQGFENHIGTNHFGHFYLTQLLLPKMKAQAHPSRIAVVSSMMHQIGSLYLDDLHFKTRRYFPWLAYCHSKLANLLFVKELADRCEGTGVRAFSLHPGVIMTGIQRNMFSISRLAISFFSDKTVAQGASTTVFACVAPVLTAHNE
eukprot:RCo016495